MNAPQLLTAIARIDGVPLRTSDFGMPRTDDLVVVRYEVADCESSMRPRVLVVVNSDGARCDKAPLQHINVVNWRDLYDVPGECAVQRTLDSLDLGSHDPSAVVEAFRRKVVDNVSSFPVRPEPLNNWIGHTTTQVHRHPSVAAVRNALIGGSPWRHGRRYRGKFCCDGLMSNQRQFWLRWPDFCSGLPDLAKILVDFLLSKGVMYCPDCHGLGMVRTLVCGTLHRRHMATEETRQSMRLIDHRSINLNRLREGLGYSSNEVRIRDLTLMRFQEYTNLHGHLTDVPGSDSRPEVSAIRSAVGRYVPVHSLRTFYPLVEPDVASVSNESNVATASVRADTVDGIGHESATTYSQRLRASAVAWLARVVARGPDRQMATRSMATTTEIRKKVPPYRKSFEQFVQAKGNQLLQDECSICLNEYDSSTTIASLPCKHFFHEHCILDSVAANNRSCPYCRAALPSEMIKRARGHSH